MELIRPFLQLNKDHADLAGGKGASLGEMTQAGIPVPPGFVVLSDSFEHFIKETDLIQEIESILSKVNHKEIHTVESASERIKDLILSRDMPVDIRRDIEKTFNDLNAEYVAVRSSATAEDGAEHAWAGQLESYLNTTKKDLLDKVKHCWASLFTPRAIFYRFEKGLHTIKISIAVVVQKMIDSEVSGIAFSVHPVTEDRSQLIIEAGFGLGEAIVSGSITPDSYVVEKESRRIIDINIATQERALVKKPEGGNVWIDIPEPKASSQVLTEEQILELSKIILKIENHYGFPCDIEWAYEAGKFYVVQSRPITTLNNLKKTNDKSALKELTKIGTRQHSLFYFSVWSDSDRKDFKENWLDIDITNLFISEGNSGKTSVWYLFDDLDKIGNLVADMIKTDPSFFSKIKESYMQSWSVLDKYLNKERQIENLDDFKDVYDNYVKWWSAMSLTADAKRNSDIVKKEVEGLRGMTERKTENIDKLFLEYIEKYYPELSDIRMTILPEELFNHANQKLNDNQISEIRKRLNGYILFNGNLYQPDELDKILNENKIKFEYIETYEDGWLKGKPASKGKVQGKVKIIKYKENISDLKKGEILVTEMTTPDYLSAIQRSAAIVTDEGGMNSHAAIIARELNKPCIVGTSIATRTFKDGDLVEVDADNGIVRVLDGKI
jgi:phosphoenolpyruvate synthase/pyruvate phosphate dikinase